MQEARSAQVAHCGADGASAGLELVRELLCGLLGRVADQEPGPDSRGHALHAAVIQVAGHGFDEGGLQAVHLPTLGRFTSFSQC